MGIASRTVRILWEVKPYLIEYRGKIMIGFIISNWKRYCTYTLLQVQCIYRSAAKIRPPFLGISASGKIGVGVISRKHNFLENRPTLQTDLENMLVFSSKEK